MSNMLDYLHWRGDIAFSVSPWNEVDGALCATLSYLNFHGLEDHRGWTLREAKRIDLLIEGQGNMFGPRKKMFETMAETELFRMPVCAEISSVESSSICRSSNS